MADASTKTIMLNGTPTQLGEQLATALFDRPLAFAAEQLSPAELEVFCCSYIAATAGLMARKIGRERMASLATTLANVVNANVQEQKGPIQ